MLSLRRPADDFPAIVDFLESDRDLPRNSALLHGNAIDHIGDGHRFLAVGNDDELGVVQELVEDGDKASDIGFVERGIDLIEDTERTGSILKEGHDQRDRGQRFLATAQKAVAESRLAGRGGNDFNAAFWVFGIFENDVGGSSTKTLSIELLEVFPDGFQGFAKETSGILVDLVHRLQQSLFGIDEVLLLVRQTIIAFLKLIEFLKCFHIHASGSGDLLP